MTDFFSHTAVTDVVTNDSDANNYLCDVLVLGLGNLLWADEGFGVRAVECLSGQWMFRDGVRVMDGGTQGLYLLPYIEGCTRLLILDAVDYGLPPATIKIVENEHVPAFMGARKMSLHQTGFQEVLLLAMLRGWHPEDMVLVGMQPEMLEDYGGSLTDSVKNKLPASLEIAVDFLRRWGAVPERRASAPSGAERIAFSALEMAPYERERPSDEAACRSGDDRFLFRG
ncbi:MAG: HyaD/HybD family hydrogenase maturation endopeptidase [Burkholderiales bacterium]